MSNKYKINIDPKYKCTLDDLNSILIATAFSGDDNKLEFIKTSTKLLINAVGALNLLFKRDSQLKNIEELKVGTILLFIPFNCSNFSFLGIFFFKPI